MKHTVKTKIFKILSLFPDRLGYFLYHFLQDIGTTVTLDNKIKSTNNTFETVKKILSKNDIALQNLKIAELGSGWVPIFPYQLIFEGNVKYVDTYDINEHYNEKEILKLNEYFSKQYNFITNEKKKYRLAKGVNYFPKTDIRDGNLKDINLVLSRFVLEHIPPTEIIKIHDFLYSNLKSGSYILHLISPSDHRAYSDSLLSLQDFLKYSEDEWNKIQTKFDYHNRLRLPQYLEIFKDKFEILFFEHDKINFESASFKKFKKLSIHKDFQKYSDQELMAGSINVLLKKR